MTPSHVRALVCGRCSHEHAPGRLHGTCEACQSPLLVDYDLEAVAASASRGAFAARPAGVWRYRELLPLPLDEHPVTLGEGGTPLHPAPRAGAGIGLPDLLVKDEGPNPGGTFKARGASCGVSMARSLGVREVALPTAGNAGGAWAAYGAAAGIRVHVAMPADAPLLTKLEVQLHGGELTLVDGLISDAGKLIAERAAANGWFDAATLREPYRIEGKKTLGLEIAEQLGWKPPDSIVYPAGGGVGLIGMWRAFGQLAALGWLDGPPPRLHIVQAAGCAPLVRAFEAGISDAGTWERAHTIAAGLRVPRALGDFLVLRAIRETGGSAVAVDDQTMLEAIGRLARTEGILASPEGAATLAGAEALRARGDLRPDERVVLVVTGSGLSDRDALERAASRR
jgi:threonine synthase